MAKRNTTHVLKNSNVSGRVLPTNLYGGEAIVNTADGILYFSGSSTTTNKWTPSGVGVNEAKFFEVGSNLYDLKLRNRITQYQGVSGAGLTGKFLSGTTSGFVLADISTIAGVDTFTTGFTYSNNVFTIKQNLGKPDLNVLMNTMTGLTVTGNVTATNFIGDLTGTASSATTAQNSIFSQIANNAPVSGVYNAGTITLTNLTGGTFNITGLNSTDTFVTGFTYTSTDNTITLGQNQGQPERKITIDTVSGLTVSNLAANKMVYTAVGGKLTTGNANFDGTNMSFPTNGSVSVGTGGLVVGAGGSPSVSGSGDLTVHGSLIVYGPSMSAFTSQLYVEDNNVQLNYNPTGNTTSSSIGAGWTIQDGSGVLGGDITFDIRALNAMGGVVIGQNPNISEYTGPTGYSNRGWVTQLNDIVLRSNNTATPNGVRVLAEFDILDGGAY